MGLLLRSCRPCLRILLPLILCVRATARCRFALNFDCADFLTNASAAPAFLLDYARGQSAFASPGVGLDEETGLTFDGHPLDYASGQPAGSPHAFSAASKESVHVALLALSLRGSEVASAAVGGAAASAAVAARKLASYSAFNASRPGYGCHLPWFLTPSMAPAADWASPPRVPALDNGELAWAVFALADALGAASEADPSLAPLAAGWGAWFTCMAASAKPVFYAGGGRVAAVVAIANVSLPPVANTYTNSGGYFLDDPYEGEAFTVLLDLFAPLSPAERAQLWAAKRAKLQSVAYSSAGAGGRVTAQRGWWFSAHENWKAALLPYAEVPAAARVLRSTERARSWWGADSASPGLLASANDVAAMGSRVPPGYVSAAGVEALAFQGGAYRRDVLAPYGAWMLLLHNASAGACWLRNVLAAPRAQGPLGATEAVAANGSLISPLATWDTTMTPVLAGAGGVGGWVGAALRRLPPGAPPAAGWELGGARGPGPSAFDQFYATLGGEYAASFPEVEGESLGYGLPAASVPAGLPPWPLCA
jgi:hypothetical protein